jgi:hypothetical protein
MAAGNTVRRIIDAREIALRGGIPRLAEVDRHQRRRDRGRRRGSPLDLLLA